MKIRRACKRRLSRASGGRVNSLLLIRIGGVFPVAWMMAPSRTGTHVVVHFAKTGEFWRHRERMSDQSKPMQGARSKKQDDQSRSYPQHMVGDVGKGADDVDVESDLGRSHLGVRRGQAGSSSRKPPVKR